MIYSDAETLCPFRSETNEGDVLRRVTQNVVYIVLCIFLTLNNSGTRISGIVPLLLIIPTLMKPLLKLSSSSNTQLLSMVSPGDT